jgi:hypothetical protein
VRESLLARERYGDVGLLAERAFLPTEAMDQSNIEENRRQAVGMGQRLRQGERLIGSPQALVRVSLRPQDEGGIIRQAPHPEIDPGAKGQRAMCLHVVEGDRLLQVRVCRSRLPEETEASP